MMNLSNIFFFVLEIIDIYEKLEIFEDKIKKILN